MEIKFVKTCLAAIACASLLAIGSNANAVSLTLSSSSFLGDVIPALPESPADDAQFINGMIGLSLNGTTTVTIGTHVNTVVRSGNSLSPLPTADSSTVTTAGSMTFGSGSGYTYLYAFYGAGNTLGLGHNQVGLAWDVSGMTGTFTIPTEALSHWEFFNPGSSTHTPVPDGGSTIALLGAALTGIGLLRNKFGSRRSA
jgi:VPDSG-CTERM motif